MKRILLFIIILGLASAAFGLKCHNISGYWQNELGSVMSINLDGTNRIRGEYWTAVESSQGASATTSNISGIVLHRKEGSLLAFSVLFNHGSSVATWVGQCLVCEEEKEVLHTTYLLKTYVSNPKAKWTSIIVNQNTFWRSDQEKGDVSTSSSDSEVTPLPSQLVTSKTYLGKFNTVGKWKSNLNGEIEIFRTTGNTSKGWIPISGKWKPSPNEENEIYGMSDVSEEIYDKVGSKQQHKFTAVSLGAAYGERIRGWAGHVSHESPRLLETAYLEHVFSPSCASPRTIVQFGMENFTSESSEALHTLKTSETFFEKIKKFFESIF